MWRIKTGALMQIGALIHQLKRIFGLVGSTGKEVSKQ